jgi:hypothetical protein
MFEIVPTLQILISSNNNYLQHRAKQPDLFLALCSEWMLEIYPWLREFGLLEYNAM